MLLRKSQSSADYSAAIETAVWIVQLRWFAIIGQCVAIALTLIWLRASLPLFWLICVIGVTVSANVLLSGYLAFERYRESHRIGIATLTQPKPIVELELHNASTAVVKPLVIDNRKVSRLENIVGTSLLIDVTTLTGMLYLTGGLSNPFSCFYFANIAVCGLILAPRWTWAVSCLSVLGIAVLLTDFCPLNLPGFEVEANSSLLSVRKQASFVALSTCVIVVTYFINVLMNELRNREVRLASAEAERMRSQRLEAMATLAAGAGHELASPLSTIAVVAKELSRKLDKPDVPANIVRDVALIRSELDRCREVLHRMKSGAGEASAEGFHPVSVTALIDAITLPLRQPERVKVEVSALQINTTAKLPLQAFSQAIRHLVQNGLDASSPDDKVALRIEVDSKQWAIRVIDSGSGMDAETLDRIGQPFFTTKTVGQGMGLGVFLTRNVVQGLGGSMQIESVLNQGTTITVGVPV